MSWNKSRPMSEVEMAKWAAVRARGRRHYILHTGILRYAIPCAILTTAVNHLMEAQGPFLGRLAIALLVSPVGGILFGRWMWSMNERRFREQSAAPGQVGLVDGD